MVVLFQRGAMDGLNVVVPFGERSYYQMRPTIAIPEPRARRRRSAQSISTASSACIRACNR